MLEKTRPKERAALYFTFRLSTTEVVRSSLLREMFANMRELRALIQLVERGRNEWTASVVAIALVAAPAVGSGCVQRAELRTRDVPFSGGLARRVVIDGITDGSVQVEYRTRLSVPDCLAVQGEVRELWTSYLKAEAERMGADEVVIWPEDETYRKRAYQLRRGQDATWNEGSGFGC